MSIWRLPPHVKLPPTKDSIFRAIRAAGDLGVSTTEIVANLYSNRRTVKESCIKSHVCQINKLLRGSGLRIVSDRRYWYLERRREREDLLPVIGLKGFNKGVAP